MGVNFFGYHAQAGLGGGQNDGLLGGLHASAGTPWGQNAAAGVRGNVNSKFLIMLSFCDRYHLMRCHYLKDFNIINSN